MTFSENPSKKRSGGLALIINQMKVIVKQDFNTIKQDGSPMNILENLSSLVGSDGVGPSTSSLPALQRLSAAMAGRSEKLVGAPGIEPGTSSLSETRSTTEPRTLFYELPNFLWHHVFFKFSLW